MTITEDPWAAAAADVPEGASGADVETSFDDEFGEETNPENFVGGSVPVGTKMPSFLKPNDLYGRLIIMQPLAYDPAAKTYAAKNGQAPATDTQEEFRCRVVVLRGEPVTVDEIEKQEDGTWKKTGQEITPEFPASFMMGVTQGRLVGLLKKKFDANTGEPIDGGKWLGYLRRSAHKGSPAAIRSLPFPAQYDACDKEVENWRKAVGAGKSVKEPIFSPTIAVSNEKADRELAMNYIKAERAARAAARNS